MKRDDKLGGTAGWSFGRQTNGETQGISDGTNLLETSREKTGGRGGSIQTLYSPQRCQNRVIYHYAKMLLTFMPAHAHI